MISLDHFIFGTFMLLIPIAGIVLYYPSELKFKKKKRPVRYLCMPHARLLLKKGDMAVIMSKEKCHSCKNKY